MAESLSGAHPPPRRGGGYGGGLVAYERQQTNDAGALYFISYLALVGSADAGALAGDNLAERGDEAAQNVSVLVVNQGVLVDAEVTVAIVVWIRFVHKV